MHDQRIEKLVHTIVHYSLALRPNEKVLIEVNGEAAPFVRQLIHGVYEVGAVPFVTLKDPSVTSALLADASIEQLQKIADWELARMKQMDAYVRISADENVNELADVPAKQMGWYNTYWFEPVHVGQRVPHTRWCVLRYPTPGMAQMARMSTAAFTDFYFDVCCLNYEAMSQAMQPLVQRMNEAKNVRIAGPGTDLSFSIEGIPAIACDGRMNIPDGEVFTAPVKESVNGTVTFNTESTYMGVTFHDVQLRFENGRIVEAKANDTARLEEILNTDEGARYVGEFAIGFHPNILHPMNDILFDEKIAGSFHFTPGNAYEMADNGNRSAIHWDLVCIQRPEYGGGRIEFDGEVIREDGVFLPEDLQGLNPEHLKG